MVKTRYALIPETPPVGATPLSLLLYCSGPDEAKSKAFQMAKQCKCRVIVAEVLGEMVACPGWEPEVAVEGL